MPTGISGVYAAKFYLDIHPKAQLVILDRDTCVGGVWNSSKLIKTLISFLMLRCLLTYGTSGRSYDSFWTQWTVGCAEFSDLAMPRPPEADIYYEFFKGKYTTKYLESYVDHHENSGQTLRDRIRFSIEVESLLKTKDGWIVSTTNRNTNSKDRIHTSKLIVASGLASIANMPSLAGKDEYGGDIIHQENFGSSNILSSPTVQNVTVIGGGKSSADMVYSAIKAGKTVSWILKASDTTGKYLSSESEVFSNFPLCVAESSIKSSFLIIVTVVLQRDC
jgi:dimethylaniline monooxygenase (N-oxide forming)